MWEKCAGVQDAPGACTLSSEIGRWTEILQQTLVTNFTDGGREWGFHRGGDIWHTNVVSGIEVMQQPTGDSMLAEA